MLSLKEHIRCLLEVGGNTTIHSGVFVGIFDVSAITSYNPINAISYYLFGPSNSSFLLQIILYRCPAKYSWQYYCNYSEASVKNVNNNVKCSSNDSSNDSSHGSFNINSNDIRNGAGRNDVQWQ